MFYPRIKKPQTVKELNAKTGSCQKTQDKKSLCLRQMEGAIILGKYDLTAWTHSGLCRVLSVSNDSSRMAAEILLQAFL